MISAGRWLAALLHGGPADTRICDGCGRTWTRLTPGQHTQIGAKRLPTCRRRSCTGRLWPVRTGAPTPLEDRLRAVLRAELTDAEKELLGRDAMARVEALKNRAGAPDGPGTPAKPNDCLESKDMETVPRQAQRLQPGDIITAHPDHPERDVWYRVTTWPRRITPASVLIDYTCRPEQVDGDTGGVLVLDLDQPCTVVPAHAHGGAR